MSQNININIAADINFKWSTRLQEYNYNTYI